LSVRHSAVDIRPARRSDTPVVLDFLRTIWDGEDYVPAVWEGWLASEDGELLVAESGGRAVGLSRLRDLGWGEWWLEGLRVDPAFQGHGIASLLHETMLASWLEREGRALRLATHARRKAVQHLCQRSGFDLVARLCSLRAAALTGEHGFVRLPASNLPEAPAGTGGRRPLMDLDWAWGELRHERIEASRNSSLWTWRAGEGWAVLHRRPKHEQHELLLQAFDAPAPHRAVFFQDLRALTGELGRAAMRVFPALEQAGSAFWVQAGWVLDDDEDLLLYEMRR